MLTLISIKLSLLLVCFIHGAIGEEVLYIQPEQIHIAFGDTTSEIAIVWNTVNKTSTYVRYGINPEYLEFLQLGKSEVFQDGGNEHREQFIHKVVLQNLTPNTTYFYHCGSNASWSSLYSFKTPLNTSDWSPQLAIFGDMGNYNAISLPALQAETQMGMYDAILHVGDFAYDMDTDNARVGDEFMRQIEPIAAYVPYLTCPGNHEQAYNFSNYKSRFATPNAPDSLFYSFNLGPAHIISINTEYYYFLNYGVKSVIFQYYWLENDLKEANKPENRKKHPWIITFGHRPMYCSNNDGDDCRYEDDLVRTGLPFIKKFGLEKLFYDYGVDLEIWAHEHSYERLWPVYDKKVYNGSYEAPYTNPKAPVHIITGSAGCDEYVDHFVDNPPAWSAFRSSDYGYTRMKIFNSTHLWFQQVSVEKNGKPIDEVWLIKDDIYKR